MEQVYWLEPLDKRGLLAAVVQELAGDSMIALEGTPSALGSFRSQDVGRSVVGPVHPFTAEYRATDSTMIVLPLTLGNRDKLLAELLRDDRFQHAFGAIQIARGGRVEFLAGDHFHEECVSVGPGVPLQLLERLLSQQIILAYRTPEAVRERPSGAEV